MQRRPFEAGIRSQKQLPKCIGERFPGPKNGTVLGAVFFQGGGREGRAVWLGDRRIWRKILRGCRAPRPAELGAPDDETHGRRPVHLRASRAEIKSLVCCDFQLLSGDMHWNNFSRLRLWSTQPPLPPKARPSLGPSLSPKSVARVARRENECKEVDRNGQE